MFSTVEKRSPWSSRRRREEKGEKREETLRTAVDYEKTY
jgi:hypothetical protein